MNKEQLVDKLLEYFINEDPRFKRYELPDNYNDKRIFLRGIINMRLPKEIDEGILQLEDQLLQLELNDKDIVDVTNIEEKEEHIALWQGDITKLKIGAIVNACNDALLGCFIPNHTCIDNQIHTYSGIRLRLACNDIMKGKKEETGKAKITDAYNLPSDYVIHTVGPIVGRSLTNKEIDELKSSYISCLELAKENNIRTIAFPCISTGVFHFPKNEASYIAINTVREYLKENPNSFDKVVFNVYSDEDLKIYEENFRKDS